VSRVPLIAVVDDDHAIREALDDLIRSLGYRSALFCSAEAFLADADRAAVGCMVVDVQMPGLSGLELQARLNREGGKPPMIFMSSYFDETTRSKALKAGAHCFLSKPVDDEILISEMHAALSASTGSL